MENMCREDLMKMIQSTNFTVIELGMYLDTHPECPYALSTYEEACHTLKTAIKIYEMKFGPLTIHGVETDNGWSWTATPWPWQKGCEY
ncbi:MAG: spore coat protein CotJB [Lachnospiraceae bacterium]|nr:spore coat protein CotJB [Lachnospiraceae bacterium]